MTTFFTKAILTILLLLAANGCQDWFNWNPPTNTDDATLTVYVTTNTGGPSIGPLEGAPIHIIYRNGKLAAQGVSNKEGTIVFTLAAGTYIVVPQDIPNDDDFYTTPEPQTISLQAGGKMEIRLHYNNPIL